MPSLKILLTISSRERNRVPRVTVVTITSPSTTLNPDTVFMLMQSIAIEEVDDSEVVEPFFYRATDKVFVDNYSAVVYTEWFDYFFTIIETIK